MNKFNFLLFLFSILLSSNTLAQCYFEDDYSDTIGWTQVGNEVEIFNGKVNFLNGAKDGAGSGGEGQKRVYKLLPFTLNSSDLFIVEFEFLPTQFGAYPNNPFPMVDHNLFGLTESSQEPYNDCNDLDCTGFPIGMQNVITVNIVSNNPPNSDAFFRIYARENGNGYTNSILISNGGLNTIKYITLEKTSSTNLELSVFSDANKTIHLAGSPISLSIPNNIDNLNYIQHGNSVRGDYRRQLWGEVDNLCFNVNFADCISVLNISGNIAAGTYQADDIIYSNGNLNYSNGTVNFYAGYYPTEFIELTSGFRSNGIFNFNITNIECNSTD